MSTPRVSHCVVLTLVMALSCSDDGSGPVEPTSGNVTTDAATSVSKDIDDSGGTLTTTASNGVTYTLEIPVGALTETRRVTMTPITGIDGYPLSGGLAGGVSLGPAGLVLDAPATLTIGTPSSPGAGESLFGLSFSGDATQFELAPSKATGNQISTLVSHFSGTTAGYGTFQDLDDVLANPAGTARAFADSLISNVTTTPFDFTGQLGIVRRWFTTTVEPLVQGASNDTELLDAVTNYRHWDATIKFNVCDVPLNPACQDGRQDQIDGAINTFITKVGDAIDANNTACLNDHSLQAADNVLFWQGIARALRIDTIANGLDRASVIGNLCVSVALDSLAAPQNLQVGFPHSVDLFFAGLFRDFFRKPAICHVTVAATHATVQHPTGFTNLGGLYTTVITATSDAPVELTINACFKFPNDVVASDVCATFVRTIGAGVDLTGSYFGTYSSPQGVQSMRMALEQNQNAVSGTVTLGTGFFIGRLTATLAGLQLLNVDVQPTSCTTGGGFHAASAQVIQFGNTYQIQMNPTGTDCSGRTVSNVNVCGPDGIHLSGSYGGHIELSTPSEDVACLGSVTYIGDQVTGTFSSSAASGSFSATVVEDPTGVTSESNVQVTVNQCVSQSESPDLFFHVNNGQLRLSILVNQTLCSGRHISWVELDADSPICP